jgi:hypothetical protein
MTERTTERGWVTSHEYNGERGFDTKRMSCKAGERKTIPMKSSMRWSFTIRNDINPTVVYLAGYRRLALVFFGHLVVSAPSCQLFPSSLILPVPISKANVSRTAL